MEEKLQQIINNIEASKFEETIRLESINDDSSILKTKLNVPIKLDPSRHYKVGLRYLSLYNNITNINSTNNNFHCSNGQRPGTISKITESITLLPGAYEITQIDAELKRQLAQHGVGGDSFDIIAHPEINRIAIHIKKEGFQIDRNIFNSITTFLGFTKNATPLSKGYHVADNQAAITDIHTIDIECSIAEGDIVKGLPKQIIYDMPSFTVPIGAKIIEQPQFINYFPLNTTLLHEITVRILDQDGNLINIPGERKFCSLKIVQV